MEEGRRKKRRNLLVQITLQAKKGKKGRKDEANAVTYVSGGEGKRERRKVLHVFPISTSRKPDERETLPRA